MASAPDELPDSLARLLGQHPSAVRSVCFSEDPHPKGSLAHLEIETKHGFVVLIDHRTGEVLARPPVPRGADPHQARQQRDLSDALPGAFADRPRFAKIEATSRDGRLEGWRFELDTGRAFTLTLHDEVPIVAASS